MVEFLECYCSDLHGFIKVWVGMKMKRFILHHIGSKSVSFTCIGSNGVSCLGIRRLTCGVDSLAGLRPLRFAAVGGLALNLPLACFPLVCRRLIPISSF